MFTGKYILAPRSGLSLATADAARNTLRNVLLESTDTTKPRLASYKALSNVRMSVLDATPQQNLAAFPAPLLVEARQEDVAELNSQHGPVAFFPEVVYESPIQPMIAIPQKSAVASVQIICFDPASGKVVPGKEVIAFSDYANKYGDSGMTDSNGAVQLQLSGTTIERLFVLPGTGSWGAYAENLVGALHRVAVQAVTPASFDVIRQMYPATKFQAGTGVTVGVLDSGCGPHFELNIVQGRCTVTDANPNDFADIAEHGTHVAGLIGGKGNSGIALRGVAPGVRIRAYRVFRYYGTKLGASNYAILKAMIYAANDGCDIINLSLGGGPHDAIVEEAIRDAGNQGMLTIVAAGNDGRAAVSYPAAYAGAFAVSAMGDENSLPHGCYDRSAILRPPSSASRSSAFIADFSNVGPQMSAVGLGVGVISTLPNNGIGVMSGTSMAAPMVAGCAASLLSQSPAIFGMNRDQARSQALTKLVTANCVKVFRDLNHEGFGLPDPATV